MRAIAVREDIRDLILDAADRLLKRNGYQKMTMDELAEEVGIGKGTIYLHFPSKEEVALSRIDRVISQLLNQLREIANGEAAPADKLRQMLLLRVLYRFDNVQHYRQSLNDLFADIRPGLLARREKHFADEGQIVAAVLKRGRRTEGFVFKDAESTAHSLLLATNSLLPYSLSPRELGKRELIESRATQIVNLLLHGLVHK